MRVAGELLNIAGVAEVAVNVTTRYACPPHFHETYTFGVFRGRASVWCRGRVWPIESGQIAVLDPREVHGRKAEARECPQDVFYPDPQLLTDLFGSPEPAHFPRPIINDPELAAKLTEAAQAGDPALLREGLYKLFVRHSVPIPPVAAASSAGEALGARISEALDSRVVDVSRAAGMSPSHFSRQFRALLGLSPRDFRRQERVSAARAMIEGGTDLCESALEAGFADQAHMTRQIRSILGVTPGALRRSRGT